jgi:hypothetical protein
MLDTLSRTQPLTEGANERLRKTVRVLVGFFAGCVVGAVAVSSLADWAWSLPVALAGVAVALPRGDDSIVCGHGQVDTRHVLPEKSGRQMNRIERTEFGRHRLRRSIENHGIDVDRF